MNVPPDDFRQPSSRTQYPPRVPLDYRLVATPVALIRDAEDYHDTEQNASSSAPAPNNLTATANTNINRVPSHHHLDTEHAALTRENNRLVAEQTALRRGSPDAKRQKQHLSSSPATSPPGTPHEHKLRLPTPVMPIPQAPTSTHGGQPTLANGPRDQFPRSATNREHLAQIDSLDGSSMTAPIPTSMGTTIPHRPPEWESMLIGILPPRAEGYSTPTHLRPLQEVIRAVLFRPGTTPDFPLYLIPPRDQYPLFHDPLQTCARNETMRSKPYPLCTPEGWTEGPGVSLRTSRMKKNVCRISLMTSIEPCSPSVTNRWTSRLRHQTQ
jgi:hypothetical protein